MKNKNPLICKAYKKNVRQTSIQTYQNLNKENMQNEVLKTLIKNPEGLTDREIALFCGFEDPNKVRPRRNELVKMNLVKELGKRKCRVTNKIAIVWCTK